MIRFLAALCLAACAEGADAPTEQSSKDAGARSDAGSEDDADAGSELLAPLEGRSGPWGACGPAPLSEAVPAEVLEVAEEALRPGGYAAQDIPGFTNATKCRQTSLGDPYRFGIVDRTVLNGSDTPDSFVLFFDSFRVVWFCDGRAAGHLDIRLSEGSWHVTGHGQSSDLASQADRLAIDHASECTRGRLADQRNSLTWLIFTDKTAGVLVHPLFSGGTRAHTKAELVAELSKRP